MASIFKLRAFSRLALAVLTAVLPLALTLPVILWLTAQAMQAEAEDGARQALRQVEQILVEADRAVRGLQPLLGAPCAAASFELRRQLAMVPFIQGAQLLQDGRLRCGSLLGEMDLPFDLKPFDNGPLALQSGNAITPHVPVLRYRQPASASAAMATIDGRYLQQVLQRYGAGSPLYLQVGNEWMDSKGNASAGRSPAFDWIQVQQASARYPVLSVCTGYDYRDWRARVRDFRPLFIAMGLLGLLAGGWVFWLLGRPASPRRELERALAAREFEPYLQPIVRPGQAGWQGAEVLMRWRHPQQGLVRPDLFIPLAEESGLIVPMTRQIIHQTAQALRDAPLPPGFHLGVNICRAHFARGDELYRDCQQLLSMLPPGKLALTLELTERELLEITPEVESLFQRLHALDVSIALDDFGTGHSSLVYLQQLKVDGLKIDQRFVAGIGSDGLSAHIVDSVAELARKLGLKTVAEGVETPQQQEYLQRLGVDWLQGYHIARPMPLAEFVAHPKLRER